MITFDKYNEQELLNPSSKSVIHIFPHETILPFDEGWVSFPRLIELSSPPFSNGDSYVLA